MQLSTDQRDALVRKVIQLTSQLKFCCGDAPCEGHDVRERVMCQLRGLAVPLWLDESCPRD